MNERRVGIVTNIKDKLLRLSSLVSKKHGQKVSDKGKHLEKTYRTGDEGVDNVDVIARSEGRAFRGPFGIR